MERFIVFFERVGVSATDFIRSVGAIAIMLGEAVRQGVRRPYKLRNIFKQMEFVGVQSLFVVVLTGMFTGMVLALQSYNALKRFGAESLVGPTVALSMARELGPVLSGLMVTGRAGSAMATELGTMRVTEQIDALYTMGVNPVKYLVVPRLLAGLCMFPILAIVTDFVGVIGGYLVGVKLLGINEGVFIGRIIDYVKIADLMTGLEKSIVFGLITTLVACYYGYNTTGGAEGVGRSATSTVVVASVTILVADYILSSFMA